MLNRSHKSFFVKKEDVIVNGIKQVLDLDFKYIFEIYPIEDCKGTLDYLYKERVLYDYNRREDVEPIKNYIRNTSNPDALLVDADFMLLCIKYIDEHPEFYGRSKATNFIYIEVPERNVGLVLYRQSQYSVDEDAIIIDLSYYIEEPKVAVSIKPIPMSKAGEIENLYRLEAETSKQLDRVLTKSCLMNFLTDDVINLISGLPKHMFKKDSFKETVVNQEEYENLSTIGLIFSKENYIVQISIGKYVRESNYCIRDKASSIQIDKYILKDLFGIPQFEIKGGSIY